MKGSIIAVLFWVSCILAKDIYALTYQIYFYQNRKEIAAKRCENRARPELKCNGKCQLAKQLKKLEQETEIALTKKQMPPLKVKTTEWQVISDSERPMLVVHLFDLSTSKVISQVDAGKAQLHEHAIFHPPQA
jgi:hypothetical protein